MFGFLKSVEQPKFGKRVSLVSPQQRALINKVQEVLLGNYTVLPGCPADKIIDVDESQHNRADTKEGRELLSHVYFDLVVIGSETLRPICVFRMDPNAHLSEEHYNAGTQYLVGATKIAKLAMFVVPIIHEYDHFKIASYLKKVVPAECVLDKKQEYIKQKEDKKRQAEIDSETYAFDHCPWTEGGGKKLL